MQKDIIEYFISLSSNRQEEVIDQLVELLESNSNSDQNQAFQDIKNEQVNKVGLKCTECESTNFIGHGSQNSQKRYRCKDCGKTFSEFAGSPVFRLHKKELFREYLFYFLRGFPLRKISNEMDICLKTAFDWRHKILYALSKRNKKELKGLVEVDDTYFLHSEKGNKSMQRLPRKRGGVASKDGINKDHIAVFVAFSREDKSILSGVGCRGRITKKAFHNSIGQMLDHKNCLLCTDSHLTYQGYALEFGIKQEKIFARKKQYVKDKIYHIQNVNSYHSRLKNWMNRFNGVASKYLQHYLEYYGLIDELKDKNYKINESIKRLLNNNEGYLKSKDIKQQFCIT